LLKRRNLCSQKWLTLLKGCQVKKRELEQMTVLRNKLIVEGYPKIVEVWKNHYDHRYHKDVYERRLHIWNQIEFERKKLLEEDQIKPKENN
jgi:hypothetical protein